MDANTPPDLAASALSPIAFAPPCNARWRPRPGGPPGAAEGLECAPRDAELWRLARRAQGAALRLVVEWRTPVVRQLFRRDFVHVSRQLHALEASRRVQGLERAGLDDAQEAVRRRADEVSRLLARIADDLQAAIATRAPADARLAYVAPTRFQATVTSPAAHRYLALLIQADDTLCRLEMAWLLGLVEPANKAALVGDCRRALHGFKGVAAQQRQSVGEQVRALHARRRGEHADNDELDGPWAGSA